MNTKTLDEKLRAKGRKRLKSKLSDVIRDLPYQDIAGETGLYEKEGEIYRPLNLYWLIDRVQTALFKIMTPVYEQAEVDNFLKDFENIKYEIDSLQNGYQE